MKFNVTAAVAAAATAVFAAGGLHSVTAAPEASAIAQIGGEWQGVGTDRNSAKDTPQPTRCRTSNQAGERQVSINTTCNGPSGREDIRATLTLEGDRLKGSVTRSSSDLPMTINGSVSGRVNGSTTTFDVHAMFKVRARVTVAMLSPNAYSMRVADPDDGATLMNVTFRKN